MGLARDQIEALVGAYTASPWHWCAPSVGGHIVANESRNVASVPAGRRSEGDARLLAAAPALFESLARLAAGEVVDPAGGYADWAERVIVGALGA